MAYSYEPLISIIIPVYNGENYLEIAIKSALNQSYKNIEVIIIDDGSIDNTCNIYNKYKNKIRIFKKKNGGVSTALNYGISVMKGEYFSWLSHDDVYTKDKILNQIKILQNLDNRNKIIFGNSFSIDSFGSVSGRIRIQKILKKEYLNNPWVIIAFGFFSGCTFLIPKKNFNGNKFNEKLLCTQDYDLWLKFCQKNEFFFDKSISVKSRVHKSAGSSNLTEKDILEGVNLRNNILIEMEKNNKSKNHIELFNFLKAEIINSNKTKRTLENKEIDILMDYKKNRNIFLAKHHLFYQFEGLFFNAIKFFKRFGFIETIKKIIEYLKLNFWRFYKKK